MDLYETIICYGRVFYSGVARVLEAFFPNYQKSLEKFGVYFDFPALQAEFTKIRQLKEQLGEADKEAKDARGLEDIAGGA